MPFCIPKHLSRKFKQDLKAGKINLEKMMTNTSAQNRELFAKYFGEDNAKQVNTLFESKVLLKDQQAGLISFIKQTTAKPKVKKDMIARVNKMEEILTPDTEEAFLADLAEQKLGVTVTMEEAANIAELAKDATEKKAVMETGPRRSINPMDAWNSTETEQEYGRAAEDFRAYVSGLREDALRLTREELQANPVGTSARIAKEAAAVWKSLKSTFDVSVLLRQGWKVLANSPTRWFKLSKLSMKDAYNTFGGQEVMRELNAAILSHPQHDNMVKDGLAITTVEEEFPGSEILSKIPGFGIVHKAAENNFKGFIYRARVEAYLTLVGLAKQAGIKDTTGRGYARYANTIGSRGDIGSLERLGDTVNVLFFSLRKLKSDLDFLTAHQLRKDRKGFDKIAQKEAIKDVIKVISVTAAALTLAGFLGADIEHDSTSSDFGKARVGNTTFDLTGGMGSMFVLATRVAKGSLKTTSGEIIPTRGPKARIKTTDLLWNYIENKFSPPVGFIKMMAEGQTFEGGKITFGEVASEIGLPLSLDALREAWQDPKSANLLLIMLAEQAGVSANTFKPRSSGKKRAKGGL